MDVILELLTGFVKTLLLPVVAGLVCGVFVSWQAKRSLNRREFLDRVNFSLNILQDGRLKLRTVIEKPATEVFLNPEIIRMVNRATALTTPEDCLLPIRKPDDYWLCLNALLNEVSEKFSRGFLEQDMNAPIRAETYVMCLTCEVADNIRTRKLRAMLIKKSALLDFPATDPEVDFPSHTTRIITLRQLARDYRSAEKKHCFVELELCV
jgi:hypothetical protein